MQEVVLKNVVLTEKTDPKTIAKLFAEWFNTPFGTASSLFI